MAAVKDSLILWNDGVQLFDQHKYQEALETFQKVPEQTAKILFNIGMTYLKVNDTYNAIQSLTAAATKDTLLGVAYFQLGVIYTKSGEYSRARESYQGAAACFRGNNFIDYKQLGLPLRLYKWEVFYNEALAHVYLGANSAAKDRLGQARGLAPDAKSGLVDAALVSANASDSWSPVELPLTSVFRPPRSKTANMGKLDYLGQAKVLASVVEDDKFTGFTPLDGGDARNNNGRKSPRLPPARPPPPLPQTNPERRSRIISDPARLAEKPAGAPRTARLASEPIRSPPPNVPPPPRPPAYYSPPAFAPPRPIK